MPGPPMENRLDWEIYSIDSEADFGFWILNLETKAFRKIASGPFTMPVLVPRRLKNCD